MTYHLFELNCCSDAQAWDRAARETGLVLHSISYSSITAPAGRQALYEGTRAALAEGPVVFLFSNHGMDDLLRPLVAGMPAGVILLPAGADAILLCRGTVPGAHLTQVNTYLTYGGPENLLGMLEYLRRYVFEDSAAPVPREPAPIPFDGIYFPGDPRIYDSPEEFLESQPRTYPLYVGMLSHRSSWLDGNLEVETALIAALNRENIGVIPVFTSGEKSDLARSYDFSQLVTHFFSRKGVLIIQGLVNFLMHLMKGRGGMSIAETSVLTFAQLGIPVFSPIVSYFVTEADWKAANNPLASELQTDYLNPEMSGMVEPLLVGLRTPDRRGFRPLEENVRTFARRVGKWMGLRTKENKDKKIALFLHNAVCSGVEATIGQAFGLQAFDSAVAIMTRLRQEGYTIENIPETGEALRQLILQKKAFSDFRWTTVADIVDSGGCLYRMPVHPEYQGYFEEFTPAMQQQMLDTWGPAPGEGMVLGDDLIITGLRFGNFWVMVQPKRGCYGAKCTGEVCRILHDPLCPPAHQYIATYRYLERDVGVDAVIHLGTDGSLEYLPGKDSGPGQDTWSYAVLGSLPNLYPYHLGVTSEAAVAKRRANAVLLGYYPVSSSGLDPDSLLLMDALNDYDEAHRSGNGQEDAAREAILRQLASRPALLKLLHRGDTFPEGVQLVRASLLRCAQGRKCSDLHVFGENPGREEAVSYLCELLQGDGLLAPEPEETEFDFQGRIHRLVEQALAEQSPADPLTRELQYLYGQLLQCTREADRLVDTLSGRYLPASEGGMPDENGRKILPTGRNFFCMNLEKIPSPTAYERGTVLADQLLQSYLEDEGAYPKKIAMNMISLDISRTHGEQLSQFLNLLGVRPVWDKLGRVTHLEAIPLAQLGRPRIDVTLRISGVMRDTWPDAVNLLDDAVMLVSALPEDPKDNYLLANMARMEEECGNLGDRAKTIRIFGDPPGAFGAGIDLALKASAWDSDKDLARYFIQSSAFAYGNGLDGRKAVAEFVQNAKNVDLTCDVNSSRREDTLSCGFSVQVQGGFKLVAQTIGGKRVRQYQSVSELHAPIRTTSLARRVEEDLNQTLLNESWQDRQMTHGYTGAAEMMQRIQVVFDAKCTSDVVADATLDRLAEAYVNDAAMREWLLAHNAHAAEEIGRRLLELESRGKWSPDDEVLQRLRESYLSIEGDLEGGVSGKGELQGGSVEIIKDDQVENWKKGLREIDAYLKTLE